MHPLHPPAYGLAHTILLSSKIMPPEMDDRIPFTEEFCMVYGRQCEERVAEETPIIEVRKCSRLLTPVNSLIDQLHHCMVGAC